MTKYRAQTEKESKDYAYRTIKQILYHILYIYIYIYICILKLTAQIIITFTFNDILFYINQYTYNNNKKLRLLCLSVIYSYFYQFVYQSFYIHAI